jgi:hypothetical protein
MLALAVLLLAAAPADAFRSTTRRARWTLTDVSKDGRGFTVRYLGGGCEHEATAAVVEAADRIAVRLTQPVDIPEGQHEACTANLIIYAKRIRLKQPIAGRLLVGHRRSPRLAAIGPLRERGRREIRLVPRVTGLAPRDARRLLRLQGMRGRALPAPGCGPRPEVVGQAPRAHSVRRARQIALAVRARCPA